MPSGVIAGDFGVEHRDGARLRELGRRHDLPQRVSLARHSVIRRADAMNRAQRVRHGEGLRVVCRGVTHQAGVPSLDPPSELMRTVRSRGKYRENAWCTALTTGRIVAALLSVGTPTSTSTWPTAIR